VNLVLSAAPRSMVVERAVSHYNIFRNDKRLSCPCHCRLWMTACL